MAAARTGSRCGSPKVDSSRGIEPSVGRLGGGAKRDRDVGLDALLAVGTVAGRIELGRGQLEAGRGRPEREDALDRALAVGARAEDGGTLVILEGAGQDLAGAGAVVIDQHIQRHPPPSPAVGGEDLRLSLGTPAGRDDQARVDEPLGDLDRDVQQAARIASQVDHQHSHSLPGERSRRPDRSRRPRSSESR